MSEFETEARTDRWETFLYTSAMYSFRDGYQKSHPAPKVEDGDVVQEYESDGESIAVVYEGELPDAMKEASQNFSDLFESWRGMLEP